MKSALRIDIPKDQLIRVTTILNEGTYISFENNIMRISY